MSDTGKGLYKSLAIYALTGAALLLLPAMVQAQTINTQELSSESQQKKEVDIEADQMQVLEDAKKAVFTGNVDARRGTVKLKSDKLVVDYVEAKKADGSSKTEVTTLHASGHVVIITTNQRITGNWAKMNVKANQVTVGGNVVVHQGNTIIKGKKLFVDLDKNISQMTGGRVKGSFVPSSN